ncbi:MAG: CPBP family intramembrane glutamic endopeptidase [Burkholderiaceae bacterium]
MSLPFVLLALAIAAAWLPPLRIARRAVPVWMPLFAAAVVAGVVDGVLRAEAVAALGVLCALGWMSHRVRGAWPRGVLVVATAFVALAISLHLVPGFVRPLLFDHVRFTADAIPFTQALDFDKAAAGLVLLAALCLPRPGDGVPRTGPRATVARTIAGIVVVPATVLALGVALGITRVEPHWTDRALAFLAVNGLFTCVAEEAFFRGVIQERLLRVADHATRPATRAAWRIGAVAASTALFTLAHPAGDARLVLAIAAAGLGYGLVQAATRRLGPAVAVHFAVNAVHFLLFAYPALAR